MPKGWQCRKQTLNLPIIMQCFWLIGDKDLSACLFLFRQVDPWDQDIRISRLFQLFLAHIKSSNPALQRTKLQEWRVIIKKQVL